MVTSILDEAEGARELLMVLVGAGEEVTEEADVIYVEDVNIDVELADDAEAVEVENPEWLGLMVRPAVQTALSSTVPLEDEGTTICMIGSYSSPLVASI